MKIKQIIGIILIIVAVIMGVKNTCLGGITANKTVDLVLSVVEIGVLVGGLYLIIPKEGEK